MKEQYPACLHRELWAGAVTAYSVDGRIRISALVNTALIQTGLERTDRLHRNFLWHGNTLNMYFCLAEDPEGRTRRREEGRLFDSKRKALSQQTDLLTVGFLQPITVRADIEHWGVDGCSGSVFCKFVQFVRVTVSTCVRNSDGTQQVRGENL